ncbi:MAG: LamG domain-containing protein, partial [Flavobacteriaceae bacterium]|nr:LamG domain-containing protein [Flavobacteriaceae bacterium]
MKTNLLLVIVVLSSLMANGQSCNGRSFTFPGAPSNCTYTFTSTGWIDSAGNPTTVPTNVGAGTTVCILANNTDVISAAAAFKGVFYVAPGVTFSGIVNSFGKDSQIIVGGTINFGISPGLSSAKFYIDNGGILDFPTNLSPGGDTEIHNLGSITMGGTFSIGGSVEVTNYEGGSVIIEGDTYLANTFSNCGYLEVVNGNLTGGGSSSLVNLCSTYVQKDFELNAAFTNDALLIIDGNIQFNGSIFYNNDIILVKNIYLNNDDLVGNGSSSTLIVRNYSELLAGSSITGHYYYDQDDGGGIDALCGSCTADLYKIEYVDIPALVSEITVNCGENFAPEPIISQATLDFDGVDDYVSTPSFIVGESKVTIMAWVKVDADAVGTRTIAGENGACSLYLNTDNKLYLSIKTTSNGSPWVIPGPTLPYDEWHHVTGTFDASTGKMNIYVDGALVKSSNSILSGTIENMGSSDGTFNIGRLSRAVSNRQYFKGDIDEVRVFNVVLSQDQISKIIYQEIDEDAGFVRGLVVSKEIADSKTESKISWANLLAYYPMTDIISYERTVDYSSNNRLTTLHNITTLQEQTAPLPYETKADGDWTAEGTWLHGDVWDIENIPNHDGTIVKINSKVTTTASHEHLALIIEENQLLTVNTDRDINNTWYLELNGSLELNDDAQLIQSMTSDLVTGANGRILRRQDGSSNVYWYTYMSSPVGATGVTALTDNNAATNNTNNTAFQFNTLKEGDGSLVQFTNALNEAGKISTRWMYTFENGLTYYDWVRFNPSTSLDPGVGYIHKGTGNAGTTQEYIFEGKPNNGTILITADDVDGDSGNESQADVTLTSTLIGNPYPSAIDAHTFIDDNAGVIEGTLYLWQQWAGS